VLSARTPAEPASRLQGWLPSSFRPPQIRITGETSSPEIMMIRPIGDAPWPIDDPATVVYWQSDAF
jgi:hypothetical protein